MNWLDEYDRNWTIEWLGACAGSTFGYTFPIFFDWTSECATNILGGYGDAGVHTFVLDIENGFTVSHSWITNIIKARAGNEQRIARNDLDREGYSGLTFLTGDNPREIRATLARYAAIGSVFLLGLPHEEIAIREDSDDTTVPVFAAALALVDWAKPGQRVVVAHVDDDGELQSVDAVIQTVGADSIELDTAPGTIGLFGGTIMPAKAIFLEPQQNFPRYPTDVEQWQLQARCAPPIDFAPTLASLDLSFVPTAGFTGAFVTAREFGPIGNTRLFGMFSDGGAPDAGILTEDLDSGEFSFTYKPDVTTIADLATALGSSALGILTGTWVGGDTIAAGDQFANIALSGGADHGDVGTGATLDDYEDHPVWSRELNVEGTITDGVHAMTQILDHGGIPYALGTADRADWFRAVVISAGDQYDWQWFKLFMSTVRGRQKKFWLATWREDLEYVSHAADELVIDRDAGDFAAWWPSQRQHIQILQADNTVTYAEVTAAVNTGGNAKTLTLSVSLSGAAVEKISWLELCRFENADTYDTKHDQHGFDVSLIARVVP